MAVSFLQERQGKKLFSSGPHAKWCKFERPLCEDTCEFQFAEDKLRAAHRAWHDALGYYQNPRDFNASINSVLQELRGVTFALQGQKNRVEGFEDWYANIQEDLKSDEFMRWTVQARNTVVKQSDLEVHSTSRVNLILGYESHLDSTVDEVTTCPINTGLAKSRWSQPILTDRGLRHRKLRTVATRNCAELFCVSSLMPMGRRSDIYSTRPTGWGSSQVVDT